MSTPKTKKVFDRFRQEVTMRWVNELKTARRVAAPYGHKGSGGAERKAGQRPEPLSCAERTT